MQSTDIESRKSVTYRVTGAVHMTDVSGELGDEIKMSDLSRGIPLSGLRAYMRGLWSVRT